MKRTAESDRARLTWRVSKMYSAVFCSSPLFELRPNVAAEPSLPEADMAGKGGGELDCRRSEAQPVAWGGYG